LSTGPVLGHIALTFLSHQEKGRSILPKSGNKKFRQTNQTTDGFPANAAAPNANTRQRLVWQIVSATFFRLALNTARRFVYPFAPLLSRDLHVPLTAVTTLIAVNQTTGPLGLAAGPLADRWGSRTVMRLGMALLAVGMLICTIAPIYGFVLAGLLMAGLAKTVFDPAVQAFVGHRVPYERRGMAIGALETAWAGSTLIGIPAMALIIDQFGLRWSFLAMAVLGGLGYVILARVIPATSDSIAHQVPRQGIMSSLAQLIRIRPAAGMLGFALFMSMGNDNLFVVFGAWLERDFGVSLIALGFSSSVIGVAELIGESITALWADRMGLKRSLIVGLILATGCYALLPIIGTTLYAALTGLFFIFLTFEFSIVCSFSVATELLPNARATMMAGVMAAAGIGRMIGALTGGVLWSWAGLWGVTAVSIFATLLALACMLWGLRGRNLS
jgi:predicted MFS family arabinose efflux permease